MAGLGQLRPDRSRRVGAVDHGGPPSYLAFPSEDMSLGSAMRLLRDRKLAPQEIVRVDPFGVTFTNRSGKVRTAWTVNEEVRKTSDGQPVYRLRVTAENGLPAFPTAAAK